MSFFPELYFNVDNGYLEGLVRGLKAGVLSQADYLNLVQCETLEGEPGPQKAGIEAGQGLRVQRCGPGSRKRGVLKGLRGLSGNPGADSGRAGAGSTSSCDSARAQTQTRL